MSVGCTVGWSSLAEEATMCDHESGCRFDPGACRACCPVCGAFGSAEPGQPTASHQAVGSRETCPGSGQPAV